MKQKIVVLTGAGISAESGLKTFRDTDGLWEGYNVYDVATLEAWQRNPALVQEFYNERRKQVMAAKPNLAHLTLAKFEQHFEISVVTQNIDDLHERAGSTHVTHLHGVITKSQSAIKAHITYPITGWELKMGDLCEYGFQLRPNVVWFGEAVPMIETAAEICRSADIFLLIGTSLAVYPAAGLMAFVPRHVPKYVVDPIIPDVGRYQNIIKIEKPASEGIKEIAEILLNHDNSLTK